MKSVHSFLNLESDPPDGLSREPRPQRPGYVEDDEHEGFPGRDEAPDPESPRGLPTVAEDDATPPDADFDPPPAWAARAGRRNSREKFTAGLLGLKHAIRGDSSFFAHAYRGTLIALTAALLGVNLWGWCLLVFGACLVLLSELTHSAIDTLARIVGDPEEPRLKTVREIATAGVVVAAFASGTVTITVLTLKLGELLGWWT